jgi:glycosyltransferase involved in cell wall biosynthesis
MKTVLAALGLKMKVVISERNDPNKLNNKFLLKTFRNLLYACSDLLVCQTEDAKTCFSKKMQKKIVVILNPIKKDLPAWDNQNYKHKIINFCRLERQKNLPLLIDSFNEVLRTHPDYELLIYGEGKQKDFLQDYIKKKGLENYIKIEPFSSNIHQIASACQMFVSSSDYEGLSNSMLEAMAMGMPVICTDCPIGGARMVIKNRENGVLVPVGDKDALVNAMNWVIDNPDECRKLSVAAFNIRKELAIEEIIAQWRKLIY